VNLKAKILVNSSVYHSRNKRNGGHQTLLHSKSGEFGAESVQCKMGLTSLHDFYGSLLGHSTFLLLHSCL